MLAQASVQVWLQMHLAPLFFVTSFGACVGSFVNVVNYRLPAGMSVITPPSRCSTCGVRLRFFRENLPILGWFLVRGRCRACGVRISSEYMIVETLMALVFGGLYVLLFSMPRAWEWWWEVGGAWWDANGFARAWPAYFIVALLVAALISMTIIDARTFTIPIEIPLFVTAVAFIGWPLQCLLPRARPLMQSWPAYGVSWTWAAMAAGGMAGLAVAFALLRSGRWRPSFADYHEYVKEEDVIGHYPHARREMAVELRYLAPCLIGLLCGAFASRLLPAGPPPDLVQAIAGSLTGYLVGGGVVWGTRILGTLAFGREAMGLGDVHLLGAIGAVTGWLDPVLVFFVAPFSGLLWAVLSMGLSSVFRRLRRVLPYGPHLALATIVVMLCRPGLDDLGRHYFGNAWPLRGFVPAKWVPRQIPASPRPRGGAAPGRPLPQGRGGP